MAMVRLRDAINRCQGEDHAPLSAYERYRREAHPSGTVWLGGMTIPASKVSSIWFVDETDVDRAIDAHRRKRADMKRATEDLASGVLRGRDGGTVDTEWGYYGRRDPFHFRWSAYEAGRRHSDGSWYCNTCMRPAETEHHTPECHRCSDWGDCRTDYTLSRAFCPTCGTSVSFDGVSLST